MDSQSLKKHLLLENQAIEGSINQLIATTPSVLDVNDSDVIEAGLYYLPYSTGFEVETFKDDSFTDEVFKAIPNILHVHTDKEEQRFRIPNGIKGLICLYDISMLLKKHSILDKNSGIHYHIDCSDSVPYPDKDVTNFSYYSIFTQELVNKNKSWILNELDTWDYNGTYNPRDISFTGGRKWVRFKSCINTMEFRIGEITFDYSLLFKRIVHANSIVEVFKNLAYVEYYKNKNPLALYEEDIEVRSVLQKRNQKL